jgi:predicted GTPase
MEDKVIILGAAGRDFHDFMVYWSTRPNTLVVAFTETQIPGIENRVRQNICQLLTCYKFV